VFPDMSLGASLFASEPKERGGMDLRDPATGRSLWLRPVTFKLPATPFRVKGDAAFIGAERHLIRIDLASGVWGDLARSRFKGDESPALLDLRGEGFLLRSSQNMTLLDAYGVPKYEYCRSAPMLLPAALLNTLNVLLITASVVIFVSSLELYATSLAGDITGMSMGIAPAALPATPVFVAAPLLPNLLYKASQNLSRHSYVFTHVKDARGASGPGLVKIDNDTGEEVDRLARTIHETPAESASWGAATRRASGLHRRRVIRHAAEHPGRATQWPCSRSCSQAAVHE